MQEQESDDHRDTTDDEIAEPAIPATTVTIPRDIRIETVERGELRLRRIVMGNLPELITLVGQEVAPRNLITRFISEVLVSPTLDEQAIAAWDDELLKRVAVQWLCAVTTQDSSTLPENMTFEAVGEALRAQIDGQREILDKAMVSILNPAQQVAQALQKHQDMRANIVQSISATRFRFAIPRYELPSLGILPMLNSLGDAYGLTSMRTFMESNRSALDAAARLHTPIASGIASAVQQASLASSMLAQMSSASAGVGAVASFTSAVDGLQSAISQITSSAQIAQASVAAAFATSLPKFPVGTIFPNLPDLTNLTPRFEKARRAYTALEEGGFSFTEHLWNWSFILSFADAGTKVTGAAVTNRMLAHTRKEAFRQELKRTIEGSTVLRRRWKFVESALAAHIRREYHVAIPLFLAHLEGMIGDALIIKGSVRVDGHKLIERLPDGSDKLDKNNKPVAIPGLDRLVKISPFAKHAALELASDLILNSVAKDRNSILHGRSTTYDKPKFSAQLVLMIYAFAAEIAAFEAGQVSW